MVTLTIDGIEVTVENGDTILNAAEKAGVRIPTLCHDKRLVPYGSCRLCEVEVTARGRTRLMPACFNPARDGMEVVTNSEKLIERRRMQLMLLLRSHPLLCPSCDAGGNCRLQDLVHEYEVSEPPFARESRYFHTDHESHFIRFNMNLCIRCGMCVRICDEVQGERELTFVNRGMNMEVSTDFDRPLDCEFCGQCASVCPVGAISSKWLHGTGREFELRYTDTICGFCSLGCVLRIGSKDGKIVFVNSPPDSPNEGSLCVKGRYGWPYVYSQERLTKPLIKKDGALKEVDWPEAIDFVANNLGKLREGTPSKLAVLGSGRITNEEAYLLNRFARAVLGTPNLDHGGGYSYRALVDGFMPIAGYPGSANSIREIRQADVTLLVGADLTESHPLAKNEVILATSQIKKGEVIVVHSYRTKLCDRDGTKIFVSPGNEALIVWSMLKAIIDEGLYDEKALALVADGFDDLKASLDNYAPENIAQIVGVEADIIKNAAVKYANAEKSTIILTGGAEKTGDQKLLAHAALALAIVTGKMGKEGCGIHFFGDKANSQGALDMGLCPEMAPGCVSIDDEEARKVLEKKWGAKIPTEKGLTTREIIKSAANGEIKGLYVVGENPMETLPDREAVSMALDKLNFLVVQDMFMTSTAKKADAVLPVASFMEKTGTYTTADRRCQKLNQEKEPSGAKTDMDIIQALAKALSAKGFDFQNPEEVFKEITEVVPFYKGFSYDRLGSFGLTWPCVDDQDPGKLTLYEGGSPQGKASLIPAPEPKGAQKSDLPFTLIPVVLKFHSGSMSQWSESLMEVKGVPVAEMNRADMKNMELSEGDKVRITSESGDTITIQVTGGNRALEGIILAPYHYGAVGLNNIITWDEPGVGVRIEKA